MAKSGFDRFLDIAVAVGLGAATIKAFQAIRASARAATAGLGRLSAPGDRPVAYQHEVRTIQERIDLLNQLVATGRRDPQVVIITRKAVSKRCGDEWCIAERDYEGEIVAVFDAARKHVRYVMDPIDRDTYAHPKWTLEGGGEDCDGEAVLLASMLGSIGYPTKWRVVQTTAAANSGQDWDHIYLLVGIPPMNPRKWVALDLSEPHEAGWEVPRSEVAKIKDFDVA